MNTRRLAARVIMQVLTGKSLTLALDDIKMTNGVSNQDHAFIKAVSYGVCRFYHRLDVILALLVAKPIKALEIKVLILIGLYQIIYMRVKPHAAVSETVQAAKQMAWARGLVNATLRNFLRNEAPFLEKADAVSIAQFSHPNWLIDQIQEDWPEYAEMILTANNQQPPFVLRVNSAKISLNSYMALLLAENITGKFLPYCPMAIILDNPIPVEQLPGFTDGLVSVQDGAAQLAAALLDSQPGHRVLDVCAAPGGKSAHILELQPSVELVAVDIDQYRMQRVQSNLQRLQLSATLLTGDAVEPNSWWDGKPFDRILLDAPCTATGVIRRHPDIKLLRREEDIRTTVDLQKSILDSVWPLLRPGGVMLYATCSILKQENEKQVLDFLRNHSDAEELPINSVSWGVSEQCGRQIITGESSMDGFYYARLSKK